MSPTVLAEGTPDLSLQQPMMPTAVVRDLRPPTRPYQLVPTLLQRPTGTPALYTPWTPTRVLQRRKHIRKRMGFLMQILEREQTERIRRARPLPDFRAGDILEVRMMLPEAERKVTIYRGVCIARYHKGIRSSFKIYNVYPECGGVVQHIPLYMPDLMGIKVVGRIPASQERLFYLLDRETSDYTFQTGVSAAN
ncbi:mitochondrial ribosomal protein L19 [Volvox carteri f. nagariensis]|uniref:Mitochondrial ribosomal protein L19 n=1 Tax=Volvox carteri f. nagariensis TaxID=3068 RepID=D8TY39_VOLCA|nr:mitochondrial ribosomal protein L19 [Volvox carteri f. nagariensis]EFJ47482.1 mitochondrial ribosomal protein L19 [Volvox carteri f. nagariensis]|eukprot:XP_002951306.1 mitochondrial ribosomal protein L19 [Volvox carteri f. nagariensis]